MMTAGFVLFGMQLTGLLSPPLSKLNAMNTHQTPNIAELPSSQQLRKSTLTGIGIAAVLLVTVVCPLNTTLTPLAWAACWG
jgi:hypothetical protein